MSRRRRRHGGRPKPPYPRHEHGDTVRVEKPRAYQRQDEPGQARLDEDADKRAAVVLDRAANGRQGKRSFVLANRTKLSAVAVFHARSAEDLAELKEILEGLQRSYHPTNEPVRGRAQDPMPQPEPTGQRFRSNNGPTQARQPIDDSIQSTDMGQMRRQGTGRLQGRPLDDDGGIELAIAPPPARRPKLIARGTPPPDEALERGDFGRYEVSDEE